MIQEFYFGIYIQKKQKYYLRDTCAIIFIAALSTIAKEWKHFKYPSVGKWIKKMCRIPDPVCFVLMMNFLELWVNVSCFVKFSLPSPRELNVHPSISFNTACI